MAYTDMSAAFAYRDLLTYQNMNIMGANDEYFKTGNPTVTGAWTFDQNSDVNAFFIDTESTTYSGFRIQGKYCGYMLQDISNGLALQVERNLNEAGTYALVRFRENHASSTQPVLELINAGSGNDITAPNFSLKNGYIAPGGNEAMRWDVVILNLDGTSPDSIAFSCTPTKVYFVTACGFINATSSVYTHYDTTNAAYIACTVTSVSVAVAYGGSFLANDDAYITVGYVA